MATEHPDDDGRPHHDWRGAVLLAVAGLLAVLFVLDPNFVSDLLGAFAAS